MTTQSNTNLCPEYTAPHVEWALYYAARGWAVFPLRPRTKEPFSRDDLSVDGEGGCKVATSDLDVIRAWWERWPDANIGIACGHVSGIIGVDLDPRNDSDSSVERLRAEGKRLPETVMVITGSGGLHYYFRYPIDGKVRNLDEMANYPGVEVKSDGKYLVAPPSVHPATGNLYQFDLMSFPDKTPLADVPGWLLAMARGPEHKESRPIPERDLRSLGDEVAKAARALERLAPQRCDDYGTWVDVGMALCELGPAGLALWDQWSAGSAKYRPGECEKKWASFTPGEPGGKTLASLHHWAREDSRAEVRHPTPAAEAGSATSTQPPQDALHSIRVKRRPLPDVTGEAIAALMRANEPEPRLFQRDGKMVAIRVNEEGRPSIYELARNQARGHLARAARFVVLKGETWVDVPPPLDVVDDLMGLDPLPFPPLAGITETPVLRPDGTVLSRPGYDEATHLYYLPPAGFVLPDILDRPTQNDVAAALSLVREVVAEFPFIDPASEANALALLLTPVVRASIEGCAPLCLIDAPTQGTGKSLLAKAAATLATGALPAPMTERDSEAEWRKAITSLALDGTTFVLIDNVEMELKSGQLAAALTSRVWQDRLLGGNTMRELPLRATWAATGNNLRLGGDMGRRCFWVRIDAKLSQPWTREGFRHPGLLAWVKQRRGDLLAALLTLARAWHVAGRPRPRVKLLGSFEAWTGTVGGILEHAGVESFLGNLDEMYEAADGDTASWEAFLDALYREYRGRSFTTAELAKRLREEEDWNEDTSELRAALPEELAESLGRRGNSFQLRLAKAFHAKLERRYGADGLVIERGPKDGHSKVATWRVCRSTPSPVAEPELRAAA